MDPFDDLIITSILRMNEEGTLSQKEDVRIEYKETFERNSKEAKAKYAKELAAMHNCKGGYLIFGVNDKTNELTGLSNFNIPDHADLSKEINTYFQPAIVFDTKKYTINDKVLFIIYVEPWKSIPTVCIKGHQEIIKEGVIYWRYNGESAPIRAGDLIHLLNELKSLNHEEMADLKRLELKAANKPEIVSRGGGSMSGKYHMNIINEGETTDILSIEILEGPIVVYHYFNLPHKIKKMEEVKLYFIPNEGKAFFQTNYKLKIVVIDRIGFKYMYEGTFHGPNGKFGEILIEKQG